MECNGSQANISFVSNLTSSAVRISKLSGSFDSTRRSLAHHHIGPTLLIPHPSVSSSSRLVSLSALNDTPKSTPVQFLHYTLIHLPTFAVTDLPRMNY